MMKVQPVRLDHHDGGDCGASRLLLDDPGERIENARAAARRGRSFRARAPGRRAATPARAGTSSLWNTSSPASCSRPALLTGAMCRLTRTAPWPGRSITACCLVATLPSATTFARGATSCGSGVPSGAMNRRTSWIRVSVSTGFPHRAIACVLHRRIRPDAGSQRQAATGSKSRTESSIEGNGAEDGIPCFPMLRVNDTPAADSSVRNTTDSRCAILNTHPWRRPRSGLKGRNRRRPGGLAPWPPARGAQSKV